jgi:hypothetical protein
MQQEFSLAITGQGQADKAHQADDENGQIQPQTGIAHGSTQAGISTALSTAIKAVGRTMPTQARVALLVLNTHITAMVYQTKLNIFAARTAWALGKGQSTVSNTVAAAARA